MKQLQSIPNAPYLVESMRSLGYSFEDAIADLVDNSISARAKHVKIIQKPSDNPELIVFDDGDGMSEEELIEALRFGSRSPDEIREGDDLGRFGLGMKTASLSQCRKLIVASKKSGKISCASWDLDVIKDTNDWSVIQYDDENEVNELPELQRLFSMVESGTYVLLRNFDRLAESSDSIQSAMTDCIAKTRDHLSLVFHRIISENGVRIDINNNPIEPLDPFLEYHKGTQKLQTERIYIDGEEIIAQPFILPHMNNLTKEDFRRVGGKDDLRANQGFYIYRCKRLIIWGTWFRLENKRELNKLARVRVDIPNSLDSIWSIDVKKSTATIPQKIRKQLSNTISDAIFKSGRTITHRRKLDRDNDYVYIWNRETDSDDNAIYSINREHQLLQLFYDTLDDSQQKIFENILETIESGLLAPNLYADAAADKLARCLRNKEELFSQFSESINYAVKIGIPRDEIINVLAKQEPFIDYANFKEEWEKHNDITR